MGGPNREELLKMAIQSAKQGNKDGARMMLQQVLNQDKNNERAMLWMAKVANTPGERRKWLQGVVSVNPNNETAKQALEKLATTKTASENQKLFTYGGAGVGALLFITLIITAFWAFAPLS